MVEPKCTSANRTTIEELLKDKTFEPRAREPLSDLVSEKYLACLSEFAKGDHKQCVQCMLANGLLNAELLRTDHRVWKLFVSACQEVDFQLLGTSVMRAVRATFADVEYSAFEEMLAREPLNERIAGLLAQSKCYFKVAELDNATSSMERLSVLTKNSINEVISLVEGGQEARQLRDLVIFYLVTIQVRGLHNRDPKALFAGLYEEMPKLRIVLQQNVELTGSGATLDTCIVQELNNAIEKKKTIQVRTTTQSSRHKSKSVSQKDADKMHTKHPKDPLSHTSTDFETPRKSQTQLISFSRLTHLKGHLVKVQQFVLNKNVAPVIILALFFALKKSQTLVQLAQKTPALSKRLMALLNLLLSI
ncbi:LAME_0B02300g1_1 [Lachancea meyersii CBS 8951]|uniref:LAME_0B02300g1_1 n=1 Tax=Lachancea meyersii CBS 8951 TaxID=1266667 RepID=A0A1G4ITH8_9SACH|nr:LAME_0B02300g1_1 [Lachancea meyersii CBS 8951]